MKGYIEQLKELKTNDLFNEINSEELIDKQMPLNKRDELKKKGEEYKQNGFFELGQFLIDYSHWQRDKQKEKVRNKKLYSYIKWKYTNKNNSTH